MSNVLEKISAFRLVPVIKIDRIDDRHKCYRLSMQ